MVCKLRGGPRAKGRDAMMPPTPPTHLGDGRGQEGKRRCREEMLGKRNRPKDRRERKNKTQKGEKKQ